MGEVKEYTFEELCRIVGAIAAAYGMKRVYLFGSRARGDNTADSDYDFFVVPDDDCGMFRLAGFFCKLQGALGDVDVVCDDPAEGEDFTKRISKDLRLVYEARFRNPGDVLDLRTEQGSSSITTISYGGRTPSDL